MTKIIEKILEARREGRTTVSFEFFPAKTEAGVDNLLRRIEDMAIRLSPTFVTLTWRSAFKDETLWLDIGRKVQADFGVDILMHLTCHLPVVDLKRVLANAREAGIQNILALRGDPPIGQDRWRPVEGGLRNAQELVELIRAEHGDYFCVAVAGYPEAHTECWNSADLPPSQQSIALDRLRLKDKVDAGADFVVTQFFYDVDRFLEFEKECRDIGITVPIIPGYMAVQNYAGFKKFTTWCKTAVPEDMAADLEHIKDNDEAVKAYGVKAGVEACTGLLNHGVQSLHFYTLNLSLGVTKILEGLGIIAKRAERALPWTTAAPPRTKEEVRPIFWANRAASYLSRTSAWDEYPNGRWGDAGSPAYGEITDYYLGLKRPKVKRREQWGVPQSTAEVGNVFVGYIEGSVKQLPWSETALALESGQIMENLRWMNRHGFLTINSQPKVNCAPSADPGVGWGGSGGFVFQKAYVEFFVSPELLARLLDAFKTRFTELTYHAVRSNGEEVTNSDPDHATAVTWGVFPGREVIQPTVVDPHSFRAWRDEAFELWLSQWQVIYNEDVEEEAVARGVIQEIHDKWYLVNVVDNAYAETGSDIFQVFKEVVAEAMTEDELRAYSRALQEENVDLREQLERMRDLHLASARETKSMSEALSRAEQEKAELRARVRELEAKVLMASTSASAVRPSMAM